MGKYRGREERTHGSVVVTVCVTAVAIIVELERNRVRKKKKRNKQRFYMILVVGTCRMGSMVIFSTMVSPFLERLDWTGR
jgi:hypothetical protein